MIQGLATFLGAAGGMPGAGGVPGLSASASSSSSSGPTTFGDFNFQPKGGPLPPVAWIALAGAAVVIAALYLRRG